jgi:hypothetical protein
VLQKKQQNFVYFMAFSSCLSEHPAVLSMPPWTIKFDEEKPDMLVWLSKVVLAHNIFIVF